MKSAVSDSGNIAVGYEEASPNSSMNRGQSLSHDVKVNVIDGKIFATSTKFILTTQQSKSTNQQSFSDNDSTAGDSNGHFDPRESFDSCDCASSYEGGIEFQIATTTILFFAIDFEQPSADFANSDFVYPNTVNGEEYLQVPSSESLLVSDDTGEILVYAGGYAFADGQSTHAFGGIDIDVIDMGSYTIAYGTVTFTAAAQSKNCQYTAADTDAFLEVYGADYIHAIEMDETVIYENGFIQTLIESSAIEFQNEHESAFDFNSSGNYAESTLIAESSDDEFLIVAANNYVDGNSSVVETVIDGGNTVSLSTIEAYDDDTFVQVESVVEDIDDKHSSIISSVILGAS